MNSGDDQEENMDFDDELDSGDEQEDSDKQGKNTNSDDEHTTGSSKSLHDLNFFFF